MPIDNDPVTRSFDALSVKRVGPHDGGTEDLMKHAALRQHDIMAERKFFLDGSDQCQLSSEAESFKDDWNRVLSMVLLTLSGLCWMGWISKSIAIGIQVKGFHFTITRLDCTVNGAQ